MYGHVLVRAGVSGRVPTDPAGVLRRSAGECWRELASAGEEFCRVLMRADRVIWGEQIRRDVLS